MFLHCCPFKREREYGLSQLPTEGWRLMKVQGWVVVELC